MWPVLYAGTFILITSVEGLTYRYILFDRRWLGEDETYIHDEFKKSIGLIWYLFSLAFTLAVMYEYLASRYDINELSPIINRLIIAYIKTSTYIGEEFQILLGIVIFVTAPQVLGYILSSFTGCASTPPFLQHIVKYTALWSAKILAFVSGIYMYFAIFTPANLSSLPDSTQYSCWISAITCSGGAFSLLLYYFMGDTFVRALFRHGKLQPLALLHSWATQCYPKDKPFKDEIKEVLVTASDEVATSMVDAIGREVNKRLDRFTSTFPSARSE